MPKMLVLVFMVDPCNGIYSQPAWASERETS